jgi:enoyl-CoA hydratase/carnithine racemase
MAFTTYEKSGRVAVITLNKPESRNAIGALEDCSDLAAALMRANDDSEISALILTGAGKAFCSGGDLKALKERGGAGIGPQATPDGTRANYRRGVQSIIEALANVEVATIAAINGPAIGLGMDIAILCDLRVAAQSARLASSFVKVGLIPGDGGAWILTQAVGYSRAAEMILTGDQISAEEALRIGLVNKVVPDDQLLAEAQKYAERVSVNPPRSVRLAKRLLRESQHGRLRDVMELSAAFQGMAHETADHREAVAAFAEKRPPKFTGA